MIKICLIYPKGECFNRIQYINSAAIPRVGELINLNLEKRLPNPRVFVVKSVVHEIERQNEETVLLPWVYLKPVEMESSDEIATLEQIRT